MEKGHHLACSCVLPHTNTTEWHGISIPPPPPTLLCNIVTYLMNSAGGLELNHPKLPKLSPIPHLSGILLPCETRLPVHQTHHPQRGQRRVYSRAVGQRTRNTPRSAQPHARCGELFLRLLYNEGGQEVSEHVRLEDAEDGREVRSAVRPVRPAPAHQLIQHQRVGTLL